jgi:hypothetical protein
MKRQHDLGGEPAGPIDPSHHEAEPFGKLFTAIFNALQQHDVTNVDELRRTLEDLPKAVYDQPYYERWGEALCKLLEEKDIVSRAEIERRMAELKTEIEAAR